jgi:tRNA A-37 threonylcarbamoyl transferase component Bud32
MDIPMLIQVIEDDLKPAVATQNLPAGSVDLEIYNSGIQMSMQDLMEKRPSTNQGQDLKSAYILLNVSKDPEYSMKILSEICLAYDKLVMRHQHRRASILEGFLEALEELGDKYTTCEEFFAIVNAISVLKGAEVDISDLMSSLYPHFSSMMHSFTVEINENLPNSFKKLEEMIKVLQNAESIGLSNENLNYMVLDNIFTFIEEVTDYINIAQNEQRRVENEECAILLGYANQIKSSSEDFQGKIEEFKAIVGIKEPVPSVPEQNQLIQERLEPVNYLRSPLPGVVEESKAIYSYEHSDFHVEIKRADYRGQRIAIKNYSKLQNKPWDPKKFETEIQILERCSRLAEESKNSLGFLKFYGAKMEKDCVSIYLEHMDEDLFKRIQSFKDQKISFSENELKAIATQLIQSFSALQTIGIMHQDIKPANILVSGSGEDVVVKIIDFGVSKFKRYGMATTQTADAVTTSYYRAPELVGHVQTNFNSFKADTYSLAITFYEMYTLQDIKDINNPSRQNELMNSLDSITFIWLKNLLKRMMADHSRRFTFRDCLPLLPGLKTEYN